MRTPTQARLRLLRDLVRDYQGDIKTGMVQKYYAAKLGAGDWRGKARQDLDQLVREGLLILDDRDPNTRVFRRNHAHPGGA
ncbi:hypothetical protein [Streptomyces sp. bgisy029]|uniref:hypothetical protein n=1 Tax=Streptomyces sp. bgisy029 TaxID=3413771 RepID=UPI003D71225A